MYENISGLYTVESLQEEREISRQSAINILHKLKKQNRVELIGGSKKRLYKIHKQPIQKTNGMYRIINQTPIKLYEDIKHYSYGKPPSVEQTIVDALSRHEVRYQMAVAFLINKITNWSKLFRQLKQKALEKDFMYVYNTARKSFKTKKIPSKYENQTENKLRFSKADLLEAKNDQ